MVLSATAYANKATLKDVPTKINLQDPLISRISGLIEMARRQSLHTHPQWLALLHFNKGGIIRSKNRSYIDDSTFFISKNGKRDAKLELVASIQSLFKENSETKCRYVARYTWLAKQLNEEQKTDGLQHCKEYQQLINAINAEQIVLVFASAYLNNPSSIFGHTLLRIDPGPNQDNASILNWAVNFGALLNPKDGPTTYAIKGISGQYNGQYFLVPYAQKIKEYGKMENRDLWEYTLNLNPQEVKFLIQHLWELKEVNFDYYFFDENCSFRLLELIEVARPSLNLSEKIRLSEIPINSVKTFHQKNLIKSTKFRPSKERELNHQFSQLDKTQQKMVLSLSHATDLLSSKDYQNTNPVAQYQILQTAYAYSRYQQNQTRRNKSHAQHSLSLLKAINKLSKKVPHTIAAPPPAGSVFDSHDSHRFSIGYGEHHINNTQAQSFTTLAYRMSYHDLLDNQKAYFPGVGIESIAINARIFGDNKKDAFLNSKNEASFEISSFTLAEINSINARSKLNKPLSWRVSIRGERESINQNHLSTIFEAGPGLSWRASKLQFYQFLNPRIELNPNFLDLYFKSGSPDQNEKKIGNIKGGLSYIAGILQNDRWGSTLIKFNTYKLSQLNTKSIISISRSIELHKNMSLRVAFNRLTESEYEEDKFDQLNLSLHYYF